MKFYMLLLMVFFMMASVFSAAPQISLNSIEPNPVQPGQDVTLQLRLTNEGNDEIILGRTSLTFGDSFILKSDDQSDSESRLCTSCSKTITFFLTAKSSLESGFYTIKATTQYDSTLSVERDFSVQVTGLPNLVLNVANDVEIIPETEFNLALEIINEGTGLAKNIKLTPDSSSLGLLDENFLFQRTLDVNSKQVIEGRFLSSSSVESGYLLLPIILTYEDSQNNLYEVRETIGMEVKDRANIILQHLEIEDAIFEGESTQLSIRLENDGLGKAKNVRVSLEGDVMGQKEAFFGTINKNEDLPFIFSLTPQTSGSLPLSLTISYEDDFGEHTSTQEVVFPVEQKSNLPIIVVGVLLIVGILVLLVKRR